LREDLERRVLERKADEAGLAPGQAGDGGEEALEVARGRGEDQVPLDVARDRGGDQARRR
jgi:hypothetical protein